MYWNVPTTLPCCVRAAGDALSIEMFIVGVEGVRLPLFPEPGAAKIAAAGFARPKSSNLAPEAVSIMFPGSDRDAQCRPDALSPARRKSARYTPAPVSGAEALFSTAS